MNYERFEVVHILFRADSSSSIGTGHIMRDLVLAAQLHKDDPHAEISFATQDLDGNINHKILEAGYQVIPLHSDAKEELLSVLDSKHIEMLIIDHYGIDHKYESFIKKNSKAKILVFDDNYKKHVCDILLNHNLYADPKKYKDLVPKECELRCGKKYTLLRDEFLNEKKKRTKRTKKKVRHLFLAMGGADTKNLNIKILKVLKNFKKIKVDVVTTTANKNINELKDYVQDKKWIQLHVNSDKVAKLMRKSDLAIVTPSVTLNEVSFMGLPFIAIKTASNQNDMYDFLKKKKYPILKKFDKKDLQKHLSALLKKLDDE